MTYIDKERLHDKNDKYNGPPKTKAEEFVDNLLSNKAFDLPTDTKKPQGLQYPEWFDEKKFNRGRQFFLDNKFSFSTSIGVGVIALAVVPSILKILISTRRANSLYTAYKRYTATVMHIYSWFWSELKPGSVSWRSLHSVRSQHFHATLATKLKNMGVVSQRDVALTQFGLFALSIIRPDHFSIHQTHDGDWEAYNHTCRVIGYMLGLDDRYNVCRETVEETIEVCNLLASRVITPGLENPPEYFEHAVRVIIQGFGVGNPDAIVWWAKHVFDVPGYIYSEGDRRKLQAAIKQKLEMEGKPLSAGLDVTTLMDKPAVEGFPDLPPRLLYYDDFNTIKSSPCYKELSFSSKYTLYVLKFIFLLNESAIGRWLLNLLYSVSHFLQWYFPIKAFFRFGFKASFVNMFEEGPKDDAQLKTNAEFRQENVKKSWFDGIFSVFAS